MGVICEVCGREVESLCRVVKNAAETLSMCKDCMIGETLNEEDVEWKEWDGEIAIEGSPHGDNDEPREGEEPVDSGEEENGENIPAEEGESGSEETVGDDTGDGEEEFNPDDILIWDDEEIAIEGTPSGDNG